MSNDHSSSSRSKQSKRFSGRRQFLRSGAVATGAGMVAFGTHAAVTSGQSEEGLTDIAEEVERPGCDDGETYWKVTAGDAADDWSTPSTAERYCSLPCTFLELTDLEIGHQVRIFPEDGAGGFDNAVYTIASDHDGDELQLTGGGLDRIGAAAGESVTIGQLAVHPRYDTRQGGRLNDEYVEYLAGDEDATDVVALAPHGGFIEYGTDFQAERVAESTGGLGWVCSGFNGSGGALSRWHIHSTDIHPASFPKLEEIHDREFEWAVAFHGYTNGEILVGGTASESDRELVARELEEVLPETPVSLASSDATDYAGAAPENVLNQVGSIGRTIQLEQPTEVRQEEWMLIADGIANALDELTE